MYVFALILTLFSTVASSNIFAEEITPPSFSHEAGFFAEEFYLTLDSEPGTAIHFTTDGSVPTQDSAEFTAPIRIYSPALSNSPMTTSAVGRALESEGGGWVDNFQPRPYYNGMVVRARAFDSSGNGSETVTRSFFVENEERGQFDTRVISIAIEPSHFADPVQGIYRNWNRYDWPRQRGVDNATGPRHIVNFEMFDIYGELMLSQEAEAWVMGQFTRQFAKRSLRFNFNQGGGDVRNMPELIPDTRRNFYAPTEHVRHFRHINARLSEQHSTGIRDSLVQLLSEPLRPTIQNPIYGAVFVNGEFWGMYCLRSHRHAHLIGQSFGISRSLIEMNNDWQQWANAGGLAQYLSRHGFDAFLRHVCIDDFIDYLIIGYHFGNWDWITNNFEFWRTTEVIPDVHGADGRWRFIVQDFDHSIGSHFSPSDNILTDFVTPDRAHDWRRQQWQISFINTLFANEDFRNIFAARYSTYTGTVFNAERAEYILDLMVEEREATFGKNSYRWRLHGATNPTDGVEFWLNEISNIRNYLTTRSNYSVQHVLEHYNSRVNLSLPSELINIRWQIESGGGFFDISGAQIRPDLFTRHGLHGFDISDFNAYYIRSLPITVTASPQYGYRFSHFMIDGERVAQNPTIITPTSRCDDISVIAVFVGR
ncbi:MAG: CotH kinase family protein [Defluviitaleaceae bacterium]|nr:CotH kinase family protein [Defluviitaleaceae bacterium]